MTTTETTTPTFTDEQALAADLVKAYQAAFDKASSESDRCITSGDAGLLAVYERGVAGAAGWREITRDEITKGMRVRVVPRPSADITVTYEGIADDEHSGDWRTPEGWWLYTGNSTARIFTPCSDGLLGAGEAGNLPAGARFQVITTYQMGDTWEQEGDSTYRLLSLPEPAPDPVLVELIGPENALKIAAAGLVCEPRARQ